MSLHNFSSEDLSIVLVKKVKIQIKRKEIIKTVAERILWDPDHREKLIEYLSSALQLSKNEIELLCWEQPRGTPYLPPCRVET